jgi:uncharacterized repeat protein (TIGR03803 family)
MKNQRKSPTSSLVTAALVAAVMFAGAVLAVAQTDSAIAGARTRYQQGAIRSKAPAPTFKTLVNFNGANGANPGRPPIQGTDGNLYGTAGSGGANGSGVLFKMTPTGKNLTLLYSFCPQTGCADGSGPGALGLGMDGNFYGEATGGGTLGYGTLFKFTGSGTPITLHSFDDTDGSSPGDRMVQVGNGNFYGTTFYGGTNKKCFSGGCGTVFRITPGNKLTTLHAFCSQAGCTDGAIIYNSLALGTDGDFYGATFWGGGKADGGTIFKITPKGKLTTIYSFCVDYPACSDGSNPIGPVLGPDGNFYGTTASGGVNGEGAVFKITPQGKLTTIYSFCTQMACTDGFDARSGIILGSDGNFYGTTYYGGTHNLGTIFQITSAGVLTTLHSFDGTDGYDQIGVMFQATNGIFYGQTTLGGSGGAGTIFSLSVGLGPFVETAPTSGNVGTKVIILGNKLKGTTSVTFNGTAAVFKVVSSTEITTTVPTGATTGKVKVTTPSGTLTSNVNFQVMP